MPSSTIIIPVFNHAALTEQCVQALLENSAARIVVVDDASTDRTQEMLRRYSGRIEVITHKENYGFATSCNDGAAIAHSEYLVFLNNDTVPQAGWLTALETYATGHPEASVVGSKLLYTDRTIQHAGVVICQDRYPRHIYTGFPAEHPAVNKSRRFQIVTAACMLVRRNAFEELGGFDAAFRNGFEDVDLCLRAGQLGQTVHYCAESVVYHLESVTPGRFKQDRDNVKLYRERWLRRVQPDDLQYYLEDELLRLSYAGQFPLVFEVSALLASVDGAVRGPEVERVLQERGQQVAELLRENTRLSLELGEHTGNSPVLHYQKLRKQIQKTVQNLTPEGAKVVVVSKGDGSLLNFAQREGWHFPQTDRGVYAGHNPATSSEAIAQLEALRLRGGNYLLIPASSLWWLDYYAEFRHHLERQYLRLSTPEDLCAFYQLSEQDSSGRSRQQQPCSPPLRTAVQPGEVLVASEGSGR